MRQSKNWLVIVLLACVVVVGGVGIWSGIDSSAGALPKKYCRVLFGTEAQTEILLGYSPGRLTVFRDPQRLDSFEQYEMHDLRLRAGAEIEIVGKDGTRYTITQVSYYQEAEPVLRESLMISVVVRGDSEFKQYCDVVLDESQTPAEFAHFDGPLTIGPQTVNWEVPETFRLVAGEKPSDLRVTVGTIDQQSGCWVVVRSHEGNKSAFPVDVFPVLEVEYRAKDSGEPIQERYYLDQFC
ncbi:MAG: hypothetical protein KDA57_20485 [Planctomycetales bacterium]|nr:hypothetical protein [Planctomycetales bacterium]